MALAIGVGSPRQPYDLGKQVVGVNQTLLVGGKLPRAGQFNAVGGVGKTADERQ